MRLERSAREFRSKRFEGRFSAAAELGYALDNIADFRPLLSAGAGVLALSAAAGSFAAFAAAADLTAIFAGSLGFKIMELHACGEFIEPLFMVRL